MEAPYPTTRSTSRSDQGFTLIELLVVVLIVGILVGIAVPVYADAHASAAKRACFANQRTIEGCVHCYLATEAGSVAALEGVVDSTHPLITAMLLQSAPRCPGAPPPAGVLDVAHGAYALDASGAPEPCGFMGHGSYAH